VKILAKKVGVNVDVVRIPNESSYAEAILQDLTNADDAELVLIVVQLMNQLGLIGSPAVAVTPEPVRDTGRYIGSLR